MFGSPFRLQRSDMSYREPDQYEYQTSWFWDNIGPEKKKGSMRAVQGLLAPTTGDENAMLRSSARHAAFERQE